MGVSLACTVGREGGFLRDLPLLTLHAQPTPWNLPFARQGGHPLVRHEVVSSGEDRGGVSEEWAGWQVNHLQTLEGRFCSAHTTSLKNLFGIHT